MDLASYWSTKTQSSIIKSQNDHPLASWCSTKFEGRNKKKGKQLLIVVLLAGLFKNNVLNHNFEDLFLTKQKSIKAWIFSIKLLNFLYSLNSTQHTFLKDNHGCYQKNNSELTKESAFRLRFANLGFVCNILTFYGSLPDLNLQNEVRLIRN